MKSLLAFSRYYQDFKIEKNGESNLTQLYIQVNKNILFIKCTDWTLIEFKMIHQFQGVWVETNKYFDKASEVKISVNFLR